MISKADWPPSGNSAFGRKYTNYKILDRRSTFGKTVKLDQTSFLPPVLDVIK